MLFPSDPKECFEFAVHAFDMADRFQTPVFVVSDLDIGMNDWVVPRFEWNDDFRPDRGKVLDADALEKMEAFYRYLDVDGDEIPYRTLPGVHPKGAYFTRGSGHDRYGKYTEDAEPYKDVVDRLDRKVGSAAERLPAPEIVGEGADIGLITIGGCRKAVLEARARLDRLGIAVDYLRVRGFPFAEGVADFVAEHEITFVIEQNRDAQLRSMLILETDVDRDRLVPVLRYGGLPLSPGQVVEGVTEHLGTIGRLPSGESRDDEEAS